MNVLPYGPHALLVEPHDPGAVLPLAAAARDLGGVREVVPAARTFLVEFVGRPDAGAIRALRAVAGPAAADPDEVVLDVTYDGPDLGSTADELGIEVDELVRRHTSGKYVVAFCGFAPGFGYLTGLDESLHVARLAEPRTTVPAGSVGIASEFTGVYPRASPGGWRLLGRTDAPLWDLRRDPPALLVPGTRVIFAPR